MDWINVTWLTEHVWLVPLYPLLAALAIIFLRAGNTPDNTKNVLPKQVCMLLTVGATALGLCHAVAALGWLFAQNGHVQPLEQNWAWLQAGPLTLSMGYLLDSMSVMMLFVVTFISLLIQIYTHGYMEKDPGYCKFYAYLALFNFSMLGLVLSTNLFQIYIFWELVGLCSYLLIGFWFTRPAAGRAAVKAFLMNRVGDFGLLVGILSFLFFSFAWWQEHPGLATLSFNALGQVAPLVFSQAGPVAFATVAILLLMGPMAKSAQVPLHTWLPDAMEGPTPISALIHAATMVAAGVYLIGRMYPIFDLSPVAMTTITCVGLATAVLGATIALTQTDIKKALAYSTVSQLGFMVTAMGVGAFTAGLFHLFTHAFFKAMLFLCSGSVIHACEDEQDMRQMGGLWSKLPVTAMTYLIGTVAISGLAWTSGFWSKDEILVGASHFSPVVFWTLAITAGLTSFYMFRTFFMTFLGSYRGHAHVHHEALVMVLPLVILAIPSIGIGYLLSGMASGVPTFAEYIHPLQAASHGEHGVGWFTPIGVLSMLFGYGGLVLAYLFYGPKPVFSAQAIRNLAAPLYDLFVNKWYFDDVYKVFIDRVYLCFAEASSAFDRGVIDGLVNGTARRVSDVSGALKYAQTGKVQTYIAVVFFGVVVLSLYLIYTLL